MKIDIHKQLKTIVWDYAIPAETIADIYAGRAETFSLNQHKLRARLLVSTAWYDLLDTLGPKGLVDIISDDTLRAIHDHDSRKKFLTARSILNHVV